MQQAESRVSTIVGTNAPLTGDLSVHTACMRLALYLGRAGMVTVSVECLSKAHHVPGWCRSACLQGGAVERLGLKKCWGMHSGPLRLDTNAALQCSCNA